MTFTKLLYTFIVYLRTTQRTNNKKMTAQIKINYAEAKKGESYPVSEIKGKRVTILLNGRNVDFGISEVQIVAPR